jgi:hypothetical protein
MCVERTTTSDVGLQRPRSFLNTVPALTVQPVQRATQVPRASPANVRFCGRPAWQNWERGELILFRKHRAQVATFLDLDPQELSEEMRTRWNGKRRQLERRMPKLDEFRVLLRT